MAEFRYGHAGGQDWRRAAESCLEQLGGGAGTLGFLYLTDALANHADDILGLMKSRTGVPSWVGTVGIGICATGREYMDEPAMAAMVTDFEPGTYTVFSGINAQSDIDTLTLKCGGAPAAFAIVHADPYNRDIPELITALAGKVESGFLVGGLTSSRRQNIQVADSLLEGGLSGVAFSDAVTVATRLTQGCMPVGTRHEVTASQRNVLVTLDGRPALEVFKEDIGGKLAKDLTQIGGHVFAGLPIENSDTGDYVVRNLVGIDPANQLVAIGDIVSPGSRLMFCRRDAGTAREDMGRMLDSIKAGLYSRPRGGLYYSCLGRGPGLFGPEAGELDMIRNALGEFPLVGFFCNGEISHNRLYGYTGILTLFL
jgi:small ligand-binding sensory domain FIST